MDSFQLWFCTSWTWSSWFWLSWIWFLWFYYSFSIRMASWLSCWYLISISWSYFSSTSAISIWIFSILGFSKSFHTNSCCFSLGSAGYLIHISAFLSKFSSHLRAVVMALSSIYWLAEMASVWICYAFLMAGIWLC